MILIRQIILEDAGWVYEDGNKVRSKNGQNLEVDLIYDSTVTNDRDIGLLLQSQYAQAGIKVNIIPQDSQVYRQNWSIRGIWCVDLQFLGSIL